MVTRVSWNIPDLTQGTFILDEAKFWKANRIVGIDVAEMIAYDIWKKQNEIPAIITISEPAKFAGTYDMRAEFDAHFIAKKREVAA